MKYLVLAYASPGYWRHGFSTRTAISTLLAAFGALWLIVEISMFFSLDRATQWLKVHWWVFLGAGVAWALWENRPKHSFSCTLKNRDVKIEVRVSDLFAGDNALVIGSNTSFDTDIQTNLISEDSIQGQFTKRYYSAVQHLDSDIDRALATVTPDSTDNQKRGKSLLYPIGTTAKVRSQNRTAYFCAIAHMNAHGNAQSTIEDLQMALPKLWEYITSAGDHGGITIPVLGSGYSRIAENRESLIREILRSFIAACSAQRPCSSLSVVIRPKDFYEYDVDLAGLGSFLTHMCKYTDFASATARGRGQALPDPPLGAQLPGPLITS
jgi:hypothetical protein